MKIIKLNDLVVRVATKTEHLTASRVNEFQKAFTTILFSSNKTIFDVYFDMKKRYNNFETYDAFLELTNYLQSVEISQKNDLWSYCFALISLTENEKLTCPDDSEIKSKMQLLENNGLMFDTVKKEVENFIHAFPNISKLYTAISERLNKIML